MRARILLAAVVASLGTLVFLGLRAALGPLIEPPLYVVGCCCGAFASCFAFAVPPRRPFTAWLPPAAGICLTTYAFIGAAHLIHRGSTWDATVPDEAMGLIFWAVVATSWWLIPSTAATLMLVSTLLAVEPPSTDAT